MIEEVEIWKDIPNYDGDYQVSSFGRVKSFKNGLEIIRKLTTCKTGYVKVCLCKNGKQMSHDVHCLVAMAFLGHKPNGTKALVADHNDNDKSNNHLSNIKLITNRENASKDRKGGLSEYVGVCFDKRRGTYSARITFQDAYVHLGTFKLEIDAHNAYQKALKEAEDGLDLRILYPKKMPSSKYEGVRFEKRSGKWRASYKGKYIGIFKTEIEAHEAVQNHIKQLELK